MLHIEPSPEPRPFRMPWRNCIAVGRAYELLRADLLAHLRLLQQKIGYRYCRFHGIFHDDMAAVVRDPDGRLHFQWHQVDQVYDALWNLGLKPFVELGPMPAAMASGEQTIFWWKMNVTPPRQWEEWGQLVCSFVTHLADRYGLAEVRQWYFEVWNEPNLPGFWTGTQQDYFHLYDASAAAVKSVDPQLRVGGPSTSKASWLTEFIGHCVECAVPVDFVSTHLYPQDEQVSYPDRIGSPHAPGEFFTDTVHQALSEVRASRLPQVPIHWTEWNAMSAGSSKAVDWIDNPTNDGCAGAAFIVKNMITLDEAADTFAWWTASDVFEEAGMPHAPFSGTYGLLSIHGIRKPGYHAFRFLNFMRGNRLHIEGASPPAGCGAAATIDQHVYHVLLWHQLLPETQSPVSPWIDSLRLAIENAAQHEVISMRIRPGAGSSYETWCRMGRPQNLAPSELALLQAHAVPEHHWSAAKRAEGDPRQLQVDFALAAGEVLYLEIRPRGEPAGPKVTRLHDRQRWNTDMGAASRPV